MSDLHKKFREEIVPKLKRDLNVENPMSVPILSKIIVNIGVKDALNEKKNIETVSIVLSQITGQKPKITKAKKSIATFKLREGDKIGLVVTLRGRRMYDYFEKLVNVVLPRLRDFHGLRRTSFDGHGNYTLGLTEYNVFTEVDPGKIERLQGMEMTIVTTAKNDKEGIALLEALGMPFVKG